MKKFLVLLVLCLGLCFVTANAEEQKPLTRSEFCTHMYSVARYTGCYDDAEITKSFDDCDDKAVNLMYSVGLVSGVGDGKFNPDELITREEAGAIFGRFCKFINFPANISEYEYADHDEISDWAKTDVYTAYYCGVSLDAADDTFSPEGTVTANTVDRDTIWLYVIYTGDDYPPSSDK